MTHESLNSKYPIPIITAKDMMNNKNTVAMKLNIEFFILSFEI